MEPSRPLDSAQADEAAGVIAQAFLGDPVWRVALAADATDLDRLRAFWRFFVDGGLEHQTVYVGPGLRTVSVWLPPGADEMTPDQEREALALVERMLPADRAVAMAPLWERFAAARPVERPHAYLSLLATRPDQAGHGYGMAHLVDDLRRWDEAGLPTYLESTNPRNLDRYRRVGYTAVGRFEAVLDDAVVTTMWRPVGG